MKAAFGSVSEGGLGRPVLDVTQSGGGPSAFVANHCIGNAGAVRLSKFSIDVTKPAHGGQRPGLERIPATVGPIAMAAPTSNSNKIKFRSRVDWSVCFGFFTIAAGVRNPFYRYCGERSIFLHVI
jgi:hypothetical protein